MKHCIGFFTIFLLAILSGCSPVLKIEKSVPIQPESANLLVEDEHQGWWQLRFKLSWPDNEPLDFSTHSLIAEQLLAPIIGEHDAAIGLWRFHRRAKQDSTGHQFSFIFYTGRDTARAINQQISTNPLSQWLQQRQLIEKLQLARTDSAALSKLEQTSDQHWPIAIQRSWPYYIMGVSQTWLMLIQESGKQQPLSPAASYPELLAHYQRLEQTINTLWRDNGQHAYLHHLNAIFAYQPLKIKTTTLQNF